MPALQEVMSADPRDWWQNEVLNTLKGLPHTEFGSPEWHRGQQSLTNAAARIDTAAAQRKNSDAEIIEERGEKKNRRKRTKERTTQLVNAAIAFKMKNPGWSEVKCADEAGLNPTTLNGRPDWQEWRRKIESAEAEGRMRKVRMEFDKRIGEMVAVDPKSE